MIYILDEHSSKDTITLKGETHKYLVKVRRHKVGDKVYFRNSNHIITLYCYAITIIDGRSLTLELISQEEKEVKSTTSLHLAWCKIDTKSIEKVLPSLNEIGVEKISFISCDRTQKNFKLDFNRFKRIVESSMQQCGRTNHMEFDTYDSVDEFIKLYPDTKVFDFCDKTLANAQGFEHVLVGCEGGFSPREKEVLKVCDVFRLETPMVLRSESAVVAIASKIVL